MNIYVYPETHFETQAIEYKRLYYKYHAKRLIIDGNGMGIGLIDVMVKSQSNPDTGEVYPDFGIYNDPDNFYKQYKTNVTEENAIYIIKANASLNTEIHANLQMQLSSGKVKFLIDDKTARAKLLGTKVGANMTTDERNKYLLPFRLTSILRDELANLKQDNSGVNIILKPSNAKIGKDKVSALEYGLYYLRQEEDGKKRKKFNAKDWLFLN